VKCMVGRVELLAPFGVEKMGVKDVEGIFGRSTPRGRSRVC